jgi:ethanolamine permease
VLLAGRAVLDDPHRRRRLRLCPQRLRPWGGFLTGTAILIEYAIAPAAIAVFIGAYCQSLFGIGGWMIYLAFYIVFIGIHIFGVGEALKLMFIITAIAAIALAVFLVAWCPISMQPTCSTSPKPTQGASSFLPFGYVGVWAAIPYAIWFFLAVEGVPWPPKKPRTPSATCPRPDRRHAGAAGLRPADPGGRPRRWGRP